MVNSKQTKIIVFFYFTCLAKYSNSTTIDPNKLIYMTKITSRTKKNADQNEVLHFNWFFFISTTPKDRIKKRFFKLDFERTI